MIAIFWGAEKSLYLLCCVDIFWGANFFQEKNIRNTSEKCFFFFSEEKTGLWTECILVYIGLFPLGTVCLTLDPPTVPHLYSETLLALSSASLPV